MLICFHCLKSILFTFLMNRIMTFEWTEFLKWVKSLSRVRLCDPMDCSLPWDSPGKSTGVGCHFLPQGNLPNPGIEPRSPTFQADALTAEPRGKPYRILNDFVNLFYGFFFNRNICQRFHWAVGEKAGQMDTIQGKKDFGSWTKELRWNFTLGNQWGLWSWAKKVRAAY